MLDILLASKFLGNKLIDQKDLIELVFRFCIDFLVTFIMIRYIYFKKNKQKEYIFTYFIFNVSIFLLCILLSSIKLSIGFAFGLFAVFSILRYRTEAIPIREMTYLFVIITIAILNALSNKKVSYAELAFVNIVILVVTYVLEIFAGEKETLSKNINYEKIENVKPENRELLIKDLNERTGLNIYDFVIIKIDFLRDTAQIEVFYHEKES